VNHPNAIEHLLERARFMEPSFPTPGSTQNCLGSTRETCSWFKAEDDCCTYSGITPILKFPLGKLPLISDIIRSFETI